MPGYMVDPPALLDAAAWMRLAAEGMPTVKELLHDAVGQVQSSAPVEIGSFRDRWAEELDIFTEMMQSFEAQLVNAAETFGGTDRHWARLLGL